MTEILKWVLLIWIGIMVIFGFITAMHVDTNVKWVEKYTTGELVAIVFLWPLMLVYVSLSSVPSIIEKFENARDGDQETSEEESESKHGK